MECKFQFSIIVRKSLRVLIGTLWNVNPDRGASVFRRPLVLIGTLWNVNTITIMAIPIGGAF